MAKAKKSGMYYFYIAVICVGVATLLSIHFYPETFKVSQSVRGTLKIVISAALLVLVYLMEKEKKKTNGDLS